MTPIAVEREYFYDLMTKAFVPSFTLLEKYKPEEQLSAWIAPVLRAIALPPQERAGALHAHMKKWESLVRPWGLKAHLNTAPGHDNLFCDFAFEVALAVCAYDIDDSSFREHRYYPRDLVDHYRSHVRHTRDAWRPPGVGADVVIDAPPLSPKADLAKSKRKGLARWVELVADGEGDAVEQVIEAVGKPKKIKDVNALLCALAEENLVIHADLKDDDTLNAQAGALALARDLGEFTGPSGPPFGPARCTATLLAFDVWLSKHDYRLVAMDTDGDSWNALLVQKEFHAELLALGSELGMTMREPEKVFHN